MIQLVRDLFQGLLSVYLSELDPNLLRQPAMGVTSDSRRVRPGSIFVAISGEAKEGHQFIHAAAKAGAMLIIGENTPNSPLEVPFLKVENSRQALAFLTSSYFQHPSHSMLMVGVTGTSGKTTTTYLIESILKSAGYVVGVLGTINFRYGGRVFPSTHTTPGAEEVQELLSKMKSSGCNAVVMEVSSHALKQQRVAAIAFDAMVFTNLSPEHLDYHPDMEDYFQSKAILFTELAKFSIQTGKRPIAVVTEDDPYGARLIEQLNSRPEQRYCQVFSFTSKNMDLEISLEGIRGECQGVPICSSMTGQFNCLNIAAAVTFGTALQLPNASISQGVMHLSGVPGRLERIENLRGIHIWVDYAHKPDALQKVMNTLVEIRGQRRLLTVFGCGGDRDRKKRPWMGKIAVQCSDLVWITSDNPRTEDPLSIIQEIVAGTAGYKNFHVEVDRKKAIIQAIQSAQTGDLVLIAGKGHEDYQILGTTKIHFDDREVAREAVSSLQ